MAAPALSARVAPLATPRRGVAPGRTAVRAAAPAARRHSRAALIVTAALERPNAPSAASKEVSKPLAELLVDCTTYMEEGARLEATVTGKSREGATVEVAGLSAVIPFKLLPFKMQETFKSKPQSLVGTEVAVKIATVDSIQQKVTCDGRAFMEAEEWDAMVQATKLEEILQATIVSAANAGVVCRVGNLRAFLPGSRMTLERYVRFTTDPKSVVGDNISVMVQKVDKSEYSMVVDERSASQKMFIDSHKTGEIVTGKVRKIFDYGVLVNLAGSSGASAQGMIPVSELSWEFVATPEQVVQHGDVIQCKITKMHAMTRRVDLSLKQMEDDPLRETIDKVLPLDEAIEWETAAVPVSGLNAIVDELLMEDGVEKVTLGRQAMQQRAVSQDMELYITRCEVEDGFNLVARAGRSLQELHVVTTLSRSDMVGALGRVLKRVV